MSKEVNRSYWEEYEINFILENYDKMGWKEIGEVLNRTTNSVQMKAKRLGIKKSPYYCDYDFFENIDTEEKAYWLGFITADGWVSFGKNNSAEVSIQLAIKDYEHLKKINKSLNGNYEINIKEKKSSFNENINKFCLLRIYSIKMATDLLKYNITPNKTYEIQLVELSDELMPHFIRGYFDGDGCVYIHSHQQRNISTKFTCVSELFVEQIRKYLLKHNINTYVVKNENSNKYQTVPFYDIVVGGMKNVDTFLNYIYKDATIYLDRKLERALYLYKQFEIAKRLPRHSEMSDFYFNWERKLES